MSLVDYNVLSIRIYPDVKQLKMDKYQATLLTRWLYRNIDGTANPREHGKALSANRRSVAI